MTDTTTPAAAQRPTERVTHALVRDVELPDGLGTLALVTLDNGLDHTKPNTLGPQGVAELTAALTALQERASKGEIVAVGVAGKPYYLAAGADLSLITTVEDREQARELGVNGHAAYELLHTMGVPTFAYINGVALGGGLEVALNSDYRTIATDVGAVALPETGLGLVPGWGGAYLVPNLVGVRKAIDVILTRPALQKPFKAQEACELGLADAIFEAADFLEESIRWTAAVLRGEIVVERPEVEDAATWKAVTDQARTILDATLHGSRPAPYRALELIADARGRDRAEAFEAEDDALADLIMSDEMRASVYAFGLVSHAKRPVGAPDPKLARPVTKVGIVGAGLMAAQIALLVAQRLGVPVVMRDIKQEFVDRGLGFVEQQLTKLVETGRMSTSTAQRIGGSITGTVDIQDLAGSDLVIEAVTEVMGIKKAVFAELEGVIDDEAILATNTSALSVTEMASDLQHPERVVGIHFFNPVAKMPLVEIVQAEKTNDVALATAFAVTKKLRKTAVLVKDRPGFVVNRLLVLMMGKIVEAVEQGTPVEVADRAADPLGLPMPTFELFDLVGPAVGLHVLTSLREDLGDRFPESPGLEKIVADKVKVVLPAPARGLPKPVDPAIQAIFDENRTGEKLEQPLDEAGVLDATLTALTAEIGHMLDEGVVAGPEQIDLCMILGAGWPFHLGGITPYLDRTGYSERVLGRRLLPDGVANVPSSARESVAAGA